MPSRWVIDMLPHRLWWLGNLYWVFGRWVHLCVTGDGARSVEFDRGELTGSPHTFREFAAGPNFRARLSLTRIDFGWLIVSMLGVAIPLATLVALRVPGLVGPPVRRP